MSHPWHDIEFSKESERVQAVIEVPKGSKVKYELDKKTGLIRVDRILFSSVHYPANYGFIPQTFHSDGDPLDILVLCQEAVLPLSIMNARPIGAIEILDQGEQDHKIISVHLDDPEYRDYESIHSLPSHRMTELKRFFQDYKILENKEVEVRGFLERQEAWNLIQDAHSEYLKMRRSP